MQFAVITAPTVEPVTLAEAKDQCRVLHSAEDTLIGRLARVARSHVEVVLSRSLMAQGLRLELAGFPRDGVIELPHPPAISLTEIKYRNELGIITTLDPAAYVFVADNTGARVELADGYDWPVTAVHPQAVTVNWQGGYGATADKVPEAIRHAILLLVEHSYNNRGATSEGTRSAVPFSVDALLSPYRTTGWI